MNEKKIVPTYEISHITDLFNIPADRLDDLLDGLKDTIPTLKKIYEKTKDLHSDKEIKELFPVLKWQDDGKSYTDINVKKEDNEVVTIKVKHHKSID